MLGPSVRFWQNRRILVTGHTGFKGAWLTHWLASMGARISGLALPPHTQPNLFDLCAQNKSANIYGDVTDYSFVLGALAEHAPEIVIHMAAQALVRPSYVDPLGTYSTNVMGTANILQAVRSVPRSMKTAEPASRFRKTIGLAVMIPTVTRRRVPSW